MSARTEDLPSAQIAQSVCLDLCIRPSLGSTTAAGARSLLMQVLEQMEVVMAVAVYAWKLNRDLRGPNGPQEYHERY